MMINLKSYEVFEVLELRSEIWHSIYDIKKVGNKIVICLINHVVIDKNKDEWNSGNNKSILVKYELPLEFIEAMKL